MHSRSPITRRISLLLASLTIVLVHSISHAQTSYVASFKQNKEAVAINVLVGQSRVINFDRPVGRFSVSNPDRKSTRLNSSHSAKSRMPSSA